MKCRAFFDRTIASSKVLQDAKAEGNIPYLDGIRATATAIVFAAHLFPNNIYTLNPLRKYVDAQAGVDIFFVLSAYLLTIGFLKSNNPFSAAMLAQYFKRRAARILPLFYTVLIMFLIAVGWQNKYGMREPITSNTFVDFIQLATFTNNLDFKQTRPEMTFDGPMWSIAPEVHFYCLLPFILAYILGGGNKPFNTKLAKLLMVFLLWIIMIIVVIAMTNEPKMGLTILNRFPVFLFGIVAAMITYYRSPQLRRSLSANLFALLIVLLFATKRFLYPNVLLANPILSNFYYAPNGFLAGCFIALLYHNRTWFHFPLESLAARYLSKISFSIYMLHGPIIVTAYSIAKPQNALGELLCAMIVIVITIALSHWTYALVERPFIVRAHEK